MATRLQVVEKAREYIGVPWLHQGRSKRLGVDCIGLVICVARELGLLPDQEYPRNYKQNPDGYWLQALITKHMIQVPCVMDRKQGDLLLFRSQEHPCHVGLLTYQGNTEGVIHAYVNGKGQVVETILGDFWTSRIVGVYQFPQGLDDA